ncbi:hypothetical protein [Piscibacillus salipiscarius]|uniref:hypothetical protein n=1 Tax=Piscibacillus salipiscarius TaxID=299480 RepID=UPI0006D09A53|nr:hypothetical protein [Piscibacillus salipiscarius]
MSKQHNDDSIEKLLSEMPNINDKKTFDDYYEKVLEEINIEDEPKKKKLLGYCQQYQLPLHFV